MKSEDQIPLDKCPKCGSKETKQTNVYKCDDATVCEYTLRCNVCDTYLGSFVYGHWEY